MEGDTTVSSIRNTSMIYKGTDASIEIDILSDLNVWAYELLTNEGFENVTIDRALYDYCSMQLRLLNPKPRKVLISKELIIPEEAREGYNLFKETCESGKSLLPFMSKSIIDVSFQDKMIFDWGMFHFHLSTDVDKNDARFMERSGHLLITYVDIVHDDKIYYLQIRPHISSVWTEQELVRILVDNWPETMESRRVKGAVALTQDVTDDDYKFLRKHNINTMVDLHDGRVYIGSNLGLNAAGTSVRAISQHNRYANSARRFEKLMGEAVDSIVNTINKKMLNPGKHFKLKMITPGDVDYLFEVEECGFLLRYVIMYDGRVSIIVGDTAEQIDEVLKGIK